MCGHYFQDIFESSCLKTYCVMWIKKKRLKLKENIYWDPLFIHLNCQFVNSFKAFAEINFILVIYHLLVCNGDDASYLCLFKSIILNIQ